MLFKKIFSFILAFFSLFFSGNLFQKEGQYFFKFTEDFAFEPLTHDEMKVKSEEIDLCRKWFDENIVFAGSNGKAPAYDFILGGKSLVKSLEEWSFSRSEESETGAVRRGGKTTVITLKNIKSGVTAEIEATIYEENATAEWFVKLINGSDKRSPVVSDLSAYNGTLPLKNAELFCARGSDDDAGDFTLMKAKSALLPLKLKCRDGRPSHEYLPYFNASSKDGGTVMAVGWTGQWSASFKTGSDGLFAKIGQKKIRGYLDAGEEIRSPLISLTFYSGKNPVKGFNMFRSFIKDCVYPENTPTVMNNMDILYVSSTRTAGDMLYDLEQVDPKALECIDYLWMDAGWYAFGGEDWADCVGTWRTSPERFPNGIKEISDWGKERGIGCLLWYEPERLTNRSELYEVGSKHEGWIVDLDPKSKLNTRIMWNLGNDEAREYLTQLISQSLTDNGISVYRQDFNYSPASHWNYADRHFYSGRTGFAENHYVTGLYTYLDTLLAEHPGLLIDNCSSGGKRLDLEMARRSVPMWRSDYNCDQEHEDLLDATQAHTYSLSFWLPISGTYINFSDEYALRSSIMSILLSPMDPTVDALEKYRTEREMLQRDFFPISYGGVDKSGVTAMQYGDKDEGCVLVYKHENVGKGSFSAVFSGLEPDKSYTVTDIDDPDRPVTFSGRELLDGAYKVAFGEGRKAYVIRYSAS
ncbi:MAG: alpha-galactosidase [Clostridiales bacterium]|nr:alpha-galactosidase [Clostridiales bacterium]